MADGYLTKIEELIEGEFRVIAFIGANTPIAEPKVTKLFYHIVDSIEELSEETGRKILNIEKIYEGFYINDETRTVSYKGAAYPLDPEIITLSTFDSEINLRR